MQKSAICSSLFYLFSNVVSKERMLLIIIRSLSYLSCLHGALYVGKCQSTVRFSCFCCLFSGQFECPYSRISVVCCVFTAQKMKFSVKDFFTKCDQIFRNGDLIIFTEEILNGKLHFLCSVRMYESSYGISHKIRLHALSLQYE